jgi:hypothetical protein
MGTRKDRLVAEGTGLLASMHRADAGAWRFAEIVHLLHTKEAMTFENIAIVFGPNPNTGRPYTETWARSWVRGWERYGHLPAEERPGFWNGVAARSDDVVVRTQHERRLERESSPLIHGRRMARVILGDRWGDLTKERRDEIIVEAIQVFEAFVESELSKMFDLAEVG